MRTQPSHIWEMAIGNTTCIDKVERWLDEANNSVIGNADMGELLLMQSTLVKNAGGSGIRRAKPFLDAAFLGGHAAALNEKELNIG